ncbi:MAG: hypothetical protein GF364_22830 [Candidatus Lokiarchaeota archaeon]|nr:hypothetical protein [Candidatus Lokiarchaeota archaeon]
MQGISDEFDSVATTTSGLDSRLTTAESDIATAEGNIITLQSSMSTTETDIDNLETFQSTTTSDAGYLGLDTTVSNLTGTPTDIDGYIGAIDTEIGDIDTALAGKVDDTDDIGGLLVDVSVTEYSPGSSTLDAYLSAIDTEFGNVDTAISGKASTDHDASHIDGGSDVIDGDKIEITWTPTNYTRDSTTPSEASADDQLTAHFQGVDTRLEVIEHLARNCSGGRMKIQASKLAIDWESVSSNEIGLWNGSEWVVVLASSIPTIANTDTDLDSNALAVDSMYDVYIQYDSATSWSWQYKKWTSTTNRNLTALYDFDGVLVQANDSDGKKRRYIGVIMTWDDGGTVKFNDGRLGRYIWNHYHQQPKTVWGGVAAATSWSYSTNAWRVLNGGTNHYQAVFILMEDRSIILYIGQGGIGSYASSPYNAAAWTVPGFNSSTVLSSDAGCTFEQYNGWEYSISRQYVHTTSGITPGKQYYNTLERAPDGNQITFYGYQKTYTTFTTMM